MLSVQTANFFFHHNFNSKIMTKFKKSVLTLCAFSFLLGASFLSSCGDSESVGIQSENRQRISDPSLKDAVHELSEANRKSNEALRKLSKK